MDREAVFFLCFGCYLGLFKIGKIISNQNVYNNLKNSVKILSMSYDVRFLKYPGMFCSSWYDSTMSFK